MEAYEVGKTVPGLIFFCSKFGLLPWTDSPYHAQVSRSLTTLPDIKSPNGLSLTVILADCVTGEVKHIRLIGLGTKLSVALVDAARRQLSAAPVTLADYYSAVDSVYARYTTTDICALSTARWKLH